VPVTWEARGVVEFSDLSPEFLSSYMPELAGTQTGDKIVLRITFNTDAALIGQTTHPTGGTTFSFDGSSLQLALEVPGRGTHLFSIDPTIPPDTVSSIIGIIDNLVTGVPEQPVIDGLQFRHQYLTLEGFLEYTITTGFSTTDTDFLDGGDLPLFPDPLAVNVVREISIVDPGGDGISRSLFGTFSSLIRLPSVPESGAFALFLLGLAALAATRRRAGSA
jgi:hypothetical protein